MVTEPDLRIWPGLRRELNLVSAASYWAAVDSSKWRVPQWSRPCAALAVVPACMVRKFKAECPQARARTSAARAAQTTRFLFIRASVRLATVTWAARSREGRTCGGTASRLPLTTGFERVVRL